MIYKQYKSKDLIGKYFPSKNGEIVQLSVQSRPNTYLKIQEEVLPAKFYKIGTVGVLEWDNISLNIHLTNDLTKKIIINVVNEDKVSFFEDAIIDILYNTEKEEDLNLETRG